MFFEIFSIILCLALLYFVCLLGKHIKDRSDVAGL